MGASRVPSESNPSRTYRYKEVQLVVREASSLPVEIRPFVGKRFNSAAVVAELFRETADLDREVFVVVHLDNGLRMRSMTVSSIGTATASLVDPGQVFREAVVSGATAVLFVHNHPSGFPTPSSEDRLMTRKLIEAGKLLNVRVLDHIVIARDGYFSFREHFHDLFD